MEKGKIIFVLLLVLLFVFLVYAALRGTNQEKLKFYFFNAGKADSCVITYRDQTILVDTGEENLASTIQNYLNAHNITTIDYFIITHFDKDHVGSAAAILQNFDVSNVLQSNFPKESEYYTNYLNALREKDITPITVTSDMEFAVDGLEFVVNGPEKVYETDESNNSSLITKIVYGDHRFLLLGDAENDRLKDYLSTHTEEYDLIKVPYHGNYQKQDKTLFEITKPKYAVVSTSSAVLDDKLIQILEDYEISYYVTMDGDILVQSDGSKMKIRH